MDEKKESQDLLLEYTEYFKTMKGLQILFVIDFTSMTLKHKLIESAGVEKVILETVKESAILFKKNPLNRAYLEGEERIFIQRLKNHNALIVLITDKSPTLGSVFHLLDKLA